MRRMRLPAALLFLVVFTVALVVQAPAELAQRFLGTSTPPVLALLAPRSTEAAGEISWLGITDGETRLDWRYERFSLLSLGPVLQRPGPIHWKPLPHPRGQVGDCGAQSPLGDGSEDTSVLAFRLVDSGTSSSKNARELPVETPFRVDSGTRAPGRERPHAQWVPTAASATHLRSAIILSLALCAIVTWLGNSDAADTVETRGPAQDEIH